MQIKQSMSVKLSICICTYNRAQSLKGALSSVFSQIGPSPHAVELIVVDNNSTDDTAKVLDEYRNTVAVRPIFERRQGLAHARNRAVREFSGDYLLFTDDDVRLDQAWLSAYENAIRRFPNADYFGGRVLPDWGQEKPHWIGAEPLALIDGVLVWFDRGAETRTFERTEQLPFGASFAVSRRLFDKIGLFRVDLGTVGKGLGRGEETEFLMRARNVGAEGVYVGEALSFHAVDPKRLQLRSLYRYGVASGKSHNAITDRAHRGGYGPALWFVLRGLYQAANGHGDRFRQCVINAGIEIGTRPD